MAITRFEDLPSTNTSINSEHLNDNFDELGVKVGTSVDNNYRTNILYNKNLLYEVTLTNEYRLNVTGGLIDEIGWSTTDYIEVEENTEYIINITRTGEFHRICFYNNSKVFLSKDETTNATFTTPANTKYIRFSSYTADFSGGILQKGSLFTIPSIVVDNETIYTKGQNEEYSTAEQVIGTWIDGKSLYRKVVNTTSPSKEIGTLYNASSLNIDNIINMYCVISSFSGNTRVKVKLPYYYADNDVGTIWLEGNNINLRLTSQIYRGQSTILLLEYTKTTD